MLTEAQLMGLYDKQKLHENLMLYCRGIDRMDTELVRSTYWPDSTDDHGGYVGPGRDWADVGATYRDKLYNNNHHVSNVLIELDGDRAKRESMFMNVCNIKDPAISFFMGGRYRDLCEKRDGEWRILHRVCVWDWFEHRRTSGGWNLADIPLNSNWGGFTPDDPIYRNWESGQPTPFPRADTQYAASTD